MELLILWMSSSNWTVSAGRYAAQAGDRIPNETVDTIVHWLLQIVVSAGMAGGAVVLLTLLGRKVIKAYQDNCRDVVTVLVTVSSMAVSVYFGNLIKTVINANLIVILLVVQVVYVGIRVYVNGCKRDREYYRR